MVFRIRGRSVRLDRQRAGDAIAEVGDAVRGEVASQSVGLRRRFAALTLLALFGLGAAALTVPPGAEVFGTTPSFEWGMLIAAYVFLVVTTSGLCLV